MRVAKAVTAHLACLVLRIWLRFHPADGFFLSSFLWRLSYQDRMK